MYCMDKGVSLTPEQWPNLSAARDRLTPEYVRDWRIYECPVTDAQDQHDYTYVWEDGKLVDIQCNNSDPAVRNAHNRK